MASGIAYLGSTTQIPLMMSKDSTPLGRACVTITAISALASRWSWLSLTNHPSLQFFVRLDSHKIVP